MNFKKRRSEDPEINLIPFIDVLLVVLIFLMLSTTYSKFTEIELRLPTADTEPQRDYPKELIVGVSAEGNYSVNRNTVPVRSVDGLASALQEAAKGAKDTVVLISADASAKHQAVVTVMEAARRAGLNQITFATQTTAQSSAK
jgi:biopolymer transport protein ExbD